jgi:hypothetical protein
MCRPCLNTVHVYKEDDMLALDVRSQCAYLVNLPEASHISCPVSLSPVWPRPTSPPYIQKKDYKLRAPRQTKLTDVLFVVVLRSAVQKRKILTLYIRIALL